VLLLMQVGRLWLLLLLLLLHPELALMRVISCNADRFNRYHMWLQLLRSRSCALPRNATTTAAAAAALSAVALIRKRDQIWLRLLLQPPWSLPASATTAAAALTVAVVIASNPGWFSRNSNQILQRPLLPPCALPAATTTAAAAALSAVALASIGLRCTCWLRSSNHLTLTTPSPRALAAAAAAAAFTTVHVTAIGQKVAIEYAIAAVR
jgi:hypothetical protein